MSRVLTDSTDFLNKVAIRRNNLPPQKELLVLDAFSGDGKIWDAVKKQTDKKITILRIEKERSKGIYLMGDNIKFLKGMDLEKFDVIDLDAYGIPFEQLEIIFNKLKGNKKSILIFVTFVQMGYGRLPKKMLYELGYTKKMIDKIQAIFYKNGLEKFYNYLTLKGICDIIYREKNRKYYLCFSIGDKNGSNL
jgi:hypothetical protein